MCRWLTTPVVTYTPLAVFITIRTIGPFDASEPGCSVADDGSGAGDGPLPAVGSYLTGTYVPVHLSPPLLGRMLFDGGTATQPSGGVQTIAVRPSPPGAASVTWAGAMPIGG